MVMASNMSTEIVAGCPAIVDELTTWEHPMTIGTPNPRLLAWLITRMNEGANGTILTDDRTVRQVTDVDYLTWQLAERYERGDLEVRMVDGAAIPSMAMNHTSVMLLVDIGEFVGGVISHEAPKLHRNLEHHVENLVAETSVNVPSSPPRATIKSTFATQFSTQSADRYLACLDALWSDQLDGNEYDAIDVAVIVVADEAGWLSDLGTWGRTAGIATEADFSRAKGKLEDGGIIQVFERSEGVGRPRHQLSLNTEVLAAARQPELQLIAEQLG